MLGILTSKKEYEFDSITGTFLKKRCFRKDKIFFYKFSKKHLTFKNKLLY